MCVLFIIRDFCQVTADALGWIWHNSFLLRELFPQPLHTMAGKYSLALDEENIQRLKATAVSECTTCSALIGSLVRWFVLSWSGVLNLAVDLLVGNVDDDHIQRVSGESGLDFATCVATARAAGALLWEFTRSGTDNPATVAAILLQLGLEKNACDIFAGVSDCWPPNTSQKITLYTGLWIESPCLGLIKELHDDIIHAISEFQLEIGRGGNSQHTALSIDFNFSHLLKAGETKCA